MRIYTDEKDRLLAIWLSAEENDDASVMAALHPAVSHKAEDGQPDNSKVLNFQHFQLDNVRIVCQHKAR